MSFLLELINIQINLINIMLLNKILYHFNLIIQIMVDLKNYDDIMNINRMYNLIKLKEKKHQK